MKNQILTLAEEQLKRGGYEELSFSKIASNLKTTRANLHYHFINKETLAAEVTRRFAAKQESDIKQIAAAHFDDFFGFYKKLENRYWKLAKTNGPSVCVCTQILKNPEAPTTIRSMSKSHFENMMGDIIPVVVRSQKAGHLPKKFKPDVFAKQSMALLAGISLMAMTFDTVENSEKELKGLATEWLNYIK